MKVNELMIDDWVLDTFGKPMKVRDIITFDNKYSAKRYVNGNSLEGGGAYSQREENINPIPLTPEILEKNGFVSICDDYFAYYFNKLEIREREITAEGLYEYELEIGGVWVFIHYIHELQHILRLCKLNELADNLKV